MVVLAYQNSIQEVKLYTIMICIIKPDCTQGNKKVNPEIKSSLLQSTKGGLNQDSIIIDMFGKRLTVESVNPSSNLKAT